MKKTMVEIIKLNGEVYEINCSAHSYLYDCVPAALLGEAMMRISETLLGKYNEICTFTIEN